MTSVSRHILMTSKQCGEANAVVLSIVKPLSGEVFWRIKAVELTRGNLACADSQNASDCGPISLGGDVYTGLALCDTLSLQV